MQPMIAAFCALLMALFLIPLIMKISHRFRWFDKPDDRKIHTGAIPRLGGVGIFLAFLFSTLIARPIIDLVLDIPAQTVWDPSILSVFSGLTLIHLTGLLDDFKNLRAMIKLILQILAAGLVAAGGALIRTISLPFLSPVDLGLFSYPATILWIVGITNALNLVDGMDGLAGGIAAIASLSFGLISLVHGNPGTAAIAFCLCGAVTGFLFYNFPPARIFMGDSGSLFLGFALAVLPLLDPSIQGKSTGILIPITILTIPILDTAMAIFRRRKMGKPIHAPDKEHIHHKLISLGLKDKAILSVVYAFSIAISAVSFLAGQLPGPYGFIPLLGVWAISISLYLIIGARSTRVP